MSDEEPKGPPPDEPEVPEIVTPKRPKTAGWEGRPRKGGIYGRPLGAKDKEPRSEPKPPPEPPKRPPRILVKGQIDLTDEQVAICEAFWNERAPHPDEPWDRWCAPFLSIMVGQFDPDPPADVTPETAMQRIGNAARAAKIVGIFVTTPAIYASRKPIFAAARLMAQKSVRETWADLVEHAVHRRIVDPDRTYLFNSKTGEPLLHPLTKEPYYTIRPEPIREIFALKNTRPTTYSDKYDISGGDGKKATFEVKSQIPRPKRPVLVADPPPEPKEPDDTPEESEPDEKSVQ